MGRAAVPSRTCSPSCRARPRRRRGADLTDRLLAGLTNARHRTLGVAGSTVDLQHVLRAEDELRPTAAAGCATPSPGAAGAVFGRPAHRLVRERVDMLRLDPAPGERAQGPAAVPVRRRRASR